MAKGKKILKTSSILMIIFGAIALITHVVTLLIGNMVSSADLTGTELAEASTVVNQVGITIILFSVVGIVSAIAEVVAGIIGVKNCDNPEKAKLCLILGIIVLVTTIVSLVLSFISNGDAIFSIIASIICGLVLPVLYLVGAIQNKQSA